MGIEMTDAKNNIQSVHFQPITTNDKEVYEIDLFCLLSIPPYTEQRVLVLPDPRNTELLLGRFIPKAYLNNKVNIQSESSEDYAKEVLSWLSDLLLIRFNFDYFESKWIEDRPYGQNRQILVINAGIRDPKYIPKPRTTQFYLYDPFKDFEKPKEGVISFHQHIGEFAEKHELVTIDKTPTLNLNPFESYRIKDIRLPAGGVLALIGPNNSGKSFALRQWYFHAKSPESSFSHHSSNQYSVIARDMSVIEARLILEQIKSVCLNEIVSNNDNGTTKKLKRTELDKNLWLAMISLQLGIQLGEVNIYDFFVSCCWKSINKQNRFEIIKPQKHNALHPQNTLSKIYSESAQTDLDEINVFLNVFGYQLVPDTISKPGHVLARFTKPDDNIEFRLQDQKNIENINNFKTTNDISDGVQAATGIALEYLSSSTLICSIDEPESHLHISLQAQLGAHLARFITNTKEQTDINKTEKSFSFATHSPHFFEQFILSGQKMNIVQFNRNQDYFSAQVITFDSLKSTLLQNKYRQAQFCLAFFSKKVVIVEGYEDKLFYEEIYRRLIEENVDEICSDVTFLVGQGKEGTVDLHKKMITFGINVNSVLDFDSLHNREGGSSLISKKQLGSLFLDDELNRLENIKNEVLESHDVTELKKKGIRSIDSQSLKDKAFSLLNSLEQKKIHVVPNGEVQSFIPGLEDCKKQEWISKAMNELGDIGAEGYLRPTTDENNKLSMSQIDLYWEFVFGFTKN